MQNYLHRLLDEVSLDIIHHMWFMHDSAPSHFEKLEYLDEQFPVR